MTNIFLLQLQQSANLRGDIPLQTESVLDGVCECTVTVLGITLQHFYNCCSCTSKSIKSIQCVVLLYFASAMSVGVATAWSLVNFLCHGHLHDTES